MKHKLVILISCLLLTGCGNEKKELDSKKIHSELQDLTMEKLDYEKLAYALEEDLEKMAIYNSDEIEEQTGITSDLYRNMMMCESKEETKIYIVVEPAQNKKELIEQKLNLFWQAKMGQEEDEKNRKLYEERLEQEYGDHLIYIVDSDANEKLNKIKETKQKVFSDMLTLKKTDMETILKVSFNEIEEYIAGTTSKLDTVEQYIIIKPKKNKVSEVKQQIHNYFEELENRWKEKDPQQYALLKERTETELDDYLIYLVSQDNKSALQTIKKHYE